MFKFSKKNIVFFTATLLIGIAFFNVYNGKIQSRQVLQIDFSDFVKETEANNIKDVLIKGFKVVGHFNNGTVFTTVVPFQDRDLVTRLMKHSVAIKAYLPEEMNGSFIQILISWLPMILIISMWLFSIKQIGQGSSRAMGFGKSRFRKTGENDKKISFKDVAGADEAKEDLEEIVDFLKDPSKYKDIGARMPKGVLLSGPPGTGKTLLARAVAGEANCAFFSTAASEFVEMFVGVGASRVRDLFTKAKENLPCIIFIDEIDAMGRQRGSAFGGNDEREQTLNEFLVQLDGFEQNTGLVIFAATNRPDVLDSALTRSGRFDRRISVNLPDLKQREAILKVHARKIKSEESLDWFSIAKGTIGFSGADLENLLNESALLAARKKIKEITTNCIEEAKDKIILGALQKSITMNEKDRKLTAYHEAGHAILAYYSKNSDPIHKATIVPRGRALGMVVQLPENDKVSITKIELIERIRIAMAGRAAEEKIFGADFITSGASSDIKAATNIAKSMVLEYGMSEKLGMVNKKEESGYMAGPENFGSSNNLKEIIDSEIKKILDDAYKFALNFLNEKAKELEALTSNLLEKETLSGEEIDVILKECESK